MRTSSNRRRSRIPASVAVVVAVAAGIWPLAAPAPDAAGVVGCGNGALRTVPVASAAGLRRALDVAEPGDAIVLARGVYHGTFRIRRSGTAEHPIHLCGGDEAVLDGLVPLAGYVLHLDGADHWRVEDIRVTRGMKGVMLDGADHNALVSLVVDTIGHEGVHFRRHSRANRLLASRIEATGLADPRFGEGVYIGTALNNWCRVTGCVPDRSDGNLVAGNTIVDTAAEAVDAKEGTRGGTVRANVFSGAATTAARSWVDVKGNGYVVERNRGVDAPLDGYRVSVQLPGWGRGNVLRANVAEVRANGYGFRVDQRAVGTVLSCSNRVVDAGAGYANHPCT